MRSVVFSFIFLLFCFNCLVTHSHLFESSNNILSPSTFVNKLSRVQKGDDVKGVGELKQYLLHLIGYLDYDSYSEDHKYKNENIWYDSLEIALKKYQEFYNLNFTRIFDADTIRKMHEPRCGMPDFFNPNKKVPFHIVSHYSFFPGKPKWQKKNISYAFDWNVREEVKLPLEHALKEWASVTPFKFYHVRNFSRANIKVSFMSGDHGDGHPFRNPSGGLAHTFAPPDGRVHFDVNQRWSWTGNRYAYDVQTVGLHEFGHSLGLEHSNLMNSIMYPMIYPGERKGLSRDDINGIKALYK